MHLPNCSQEALPSFPAHELLLMLLGVAGTRRRPLAGWLTSAVAALQPQLPSMSPAQLSTAVMALAKLQHTPSTAWLAGFWRAWEAQQVSFSARGHATALWGIGTLRPAKFDTAPWAKKLQAALQQAVAQAATAVAAVALQKIRIAAQKERLVQQEQREQHQEQQDAAAGSQQQQAVDSSAAAAEGQEPGASSHTKQQLWHKTPQQGLQQEWDEQQQGEEEEEGLLSLAAQQQESVEEQPQLLGSASLLHPTDCAMVLYGLARLGPSCLDPSFPAFWLAQARSQLVNMNSQELATCIWALGKLRLLPPDAWLQQHMQCAARLASAMNHRQLAMVWWGCARLRVSALGRLTRRRVGGRVQGCAVSKRHELTALVSLSTCVWHSLPG